MQPRAHTKNKKKNNFIDYSCGKFIHFQFIALCNHNCSHHFHIESWKLESITFLDANHNYRTLLLQQLTDGSCRLVENLFVLLVLGIMRPYIDFSPRSLTLSMKTTCVWCVVVFPKKMNVCIHKQWMMKAYWSVFHLNVLSYSTYTRRNFVQ